MFSRWIVTNITSARGTLHCCKTRSPCVDSLVICGLYCYCDGVVPHKESQALRPFVIYFASASKFQTFQSRSPELSGNNRQTGLVANQEKLGEKWP
jgi:hypothetical protein